MMMMMMMMVTVTNNLYYIELETNAWTNSDCQLLGMTVNSHLSKTWLFRQHQDEFVTDRFARPSPTDHTRCCMRVIHASSRLFHAIQRPRQHLSLFLSLIVRKCWNRKRRQI